MLQAPAFPAEVTARLAQLAGAALVLVCEPDAALPRATLWLTPPRGGPPLSVAVTGLRDAQWGLGAMPAVRVTWRYARAVADVRFGTVQSFTHAPGTPPQVRVEVVLDDGARVALEGDNVTIGPIERPLAVGGVAVQPPPAAPQLLN